MNKALARTLSEGIGKEQEIATATLKLKQMLGGGGINSFGKVRDFLVSQHKKKHNEVN